MKYCFLIFLVFQSWLYAQAESANPDQLYKEFAQAYKELNVDKITKLYTHNADIINLYDGQLPGSFKGQQEIKAFYTQYFKSVANNQQQMELIFKINERKQSAESIVDHGYFFLEITGVNQPATALYGRFCTQLIYEEQQWKFKTDAATNAKAEEFENAKIITVSSR